MIKAFMVCGPHSPRTPSRQHSTARASSLRWDGTCNDENLEQAQDERHRLYNAIDENETCLILEDSAHPTLLVVSPRLEPLSTAIRTPTKTYLHAFLSTSTFIAICPVSLPAVDSFYRSWGPLEQGESPGKTHAEVN